MDGAGVRSAVGFGVGVLTFAVFGLAGCSNSLSMGGSQSNDFVEHTSSTIAIGAHSPEPVQIAPDVERATDPSTSTTATSFPAPSTMVAELAVSEPVRVAYMLPAPAPVPAVEIPLAAVGTSDGEETARVQARLLELGFWVQATDGDFGLTTTQAVMAFQKYYGIPATGSVDDQTATMMSAAGEHASGRADAGTLVEIDKSRQLLFLVVDGVTTWVFNTSTGSEVPYETPNKLDPTKIERGDSVTPVGLYHTERERPVGWWEGDLGEIYRPKYFVGGIAVHGSNSIPNYPASHGCVRVSVPAMDFIWDSDLIPLGTAVWVHGEIPAA